MTDHAPTPQEEKLRRLNRALRMLSQANQAVVQSPTEEALLQSICNIIVETSGYWLVWVGRAEQDEAKTVRPVASAGHDRSYLDRLKVTWGNDVYGLGPMGTAIRSGAHCYIEDIDTHQDFAPWREAARAHGIRSVIGLPLRSGAETFGGLCIYSRQSGFIDEGEIQLLTELAGNLAYGIKTHRTRADLLLYRKAVENSEDLICIVDREKRLRVINNTMLNYFGAQRQDVLGHPMEDMIGPAAFRSLFEPQIEQALGGMPAKVEGEHAFPVTGTRRMSFSFYPLREPDGGVQSTVSVFRDITAERELDQEREVTVALLRLLNSPAGVREMLEQALGLLRKFAGCEVGGIRIFDGTDYPYYVSYGMSEEFLASENSLLRYETLEQSPREHQPCGSPECLCGLVLSQCPVRTLPGFTRHGSFWTNHSTHLVKAIDVTKLPVQMRGRCPQEGFDSMALLPLKVEQRVFGLIQLCSYEKDAFSPSRIAFLERLADNMAIGVMRKMVTESHQRLATAAEQAGESIIITDPAGRIQYVNPAFERLTGYTAEEVVDKHVEMLHSDTPDQAAAYAEMKEALLAGRAWSGRLVNRKRDGAHYEEEATLSPVRDGAGRLVNFVSIRRDISVERSLEAQLRQSQKMEAIGRLAGGVAHDFNNLLTAISGYGELLRRAIGISNERALSDVEEILKAADRASGLTRQLLAFSRKQVLQPGILDLNAIVADMQKMLHRLIGEDIELTVQLEPELGAIRADRGQIEQVLANLAVNARDAMSQGGRLTIATANVELDAGYAQPQLGIEPGPYVVLRVVDTGCGMDAETQSHIFEPFFTTKEAGKGTGLGLSTVYGIVKQSGGGIAVYSQVGQGTAFKVFLPRVARPAQAPAAGQPGTQPASAPARNATVLVVEDDETVRDLVVKILCSQGFNVLEAARPEKALELSETFEGKIHLLVTDVVMPHMNGMDLAAKFKQQRSEIPVLYISGYTETSIINRCSGEPGAVFLQKPFTVGAFMEKLNSIPGLGQKTPD